jgi:hypothetical protein
MQTFGKKLYGPMGMFAYTIGISFSALGSLNSNVFTVGRLTRAAAKREYIPKVFAGDNSGGMTVEEEGLLIRAKMRDTRLPRRIVLFTLWFAKVTGEKRLEADVPM